MNIGLAVKLSHPVEGKQRFISEALFTEEFNEARDGGGGHVSGIVFEEVPEGFD